MHGLSNPLFAMMGLTIYDYSFMYDISLPVIVTVREENVYKGQDLVLNFAIEANILDNVPVKANGEITTSTPAVDLNVDSPNQLINRTIIISTADSQTGEPVKDVGVTYVCATDTYIGDTKITDGKATLEAKYPFCMLGGKITFDSDDYFAKPIHFSNQVDGNDLKIDVEMDPIKTINFEIRQLNTT